MNKDINSVDDCQASLVTGAISRSERNASIYTGHVSQRDPLSKNIKIKYNQLHKQSYTDIHEASVKLYGLNNTSSIAHPYPHIANLLSKSITISIDGNIGVGKSSFIKFLDPIAKVLTLREPLEKWTDISGVNLLERMYLNPKEWAFSFQTYVMLTMFQHHLHPAPRKILERSLESANKIFLRAHHIYQHVCTTQMNILDQWHDVLHSLKPIKPDLIIYLRAQPETIMQRILNRGRPEECNIQMDYLQTLHDLYEKWLLESSEIKVISINAEQPIEKMALDLNNKLAEMH